VILTDIYEMCLEAYSQPDVEAHVQTYFLEQVGENTPDSDGETEEPVSDDVDTGPACIENPTDFFFARMFLSDETFPPSGEESETTIDITRVAVVDGEEFRSIQGGTLFSYTFSGGINGDVLYLFSGMLPDHFALSPAGSVDAMTSALGVYASRFMERVFEEPVQIHTSGHRILDPSTLSKSRRYSLIQITYEITVFEKSRRNKNGKPKKRRKPAFFEAFSRSNNRGRRVFYSTAHVFFSLSFLNRCILKLTDEDRIEALKKAKHNVLLSLLDFNHIVSEKVFLFFEDGAQFWMRSISDSDTEGYAEDENAMAAFRGLNELEDADIHTVVTATFSDKALLENLSLLFQMAPHAFLECFRGKLSDRQAQRLAEYPVIFFEQNPLALFHGDACIRDGSCCNVRVSVPDSSLVFAVLCVKILYSLTACSAWRTIHGGEFYERDSRNFSKCRVEFGAVVLK